MRRVVLLREAPCLLDIEAGENRLYAYVPLPRTGPVIAKRRRLGEQALEPPDSNGGDRAICVLEAFSDAFVQRRACGDRRELDYAGAVAAVALVTGMRPNRTGEATSRSRLAEAADTVPPEGAEERPTLRQEGRHASTVGLGSSRGAHDWARPRQEVLKTAEAGLG
jgi:hypothetical protein